VNELGEPGPDFEPFKGSAQRAADMVPSRLAERDTRGDGDPSVEDPGSQLRPSQPGCGQVDPDVERAARGDRGDTRALENRRTRSRRSRNVRRVVISDEVHR
jgi:hypothetical protein